VPFVTFHAWRAFQENVLDASKVTAFSFCPPSGGSIFYSTIAMDGLWYYDACADPWYPGVCSIHTNALYVFTYETHCHETPTCPPRPVLSASWLPPNNKMTNVSLSAVPPFDPHIPGNVTIIDVQYFDTTQGRRPTLPLARWSSEGADAQVGASPLLLSAQCAKTLRIV
jgi:hypothetical protein